MKLVHDLAVGDIFYAPDEFGQISGPYTVTEERGIRKEGGHLVDMAPNTPVMSKYEAIREVLLRVGRGYATNCVVQPWIDHQFDFSAACQWISIGCWDADVAAAFHAAGVKPEVAWHVLNPIISVRCNYTTLSVLIARAQEHQHESG
jgi:hypothetical protein